MMGEALFRTCSYWKLAIIPIPENVLVKGQNRRHVKQLLVANKVPVTLSQPYSKAPVLSTQNEHRRILRFLRELPPETETPLDITLDMAYDVLTAAFPKREELGSVYAPNENCATPGRPQADISISECGSYHSTKR
eukprot:Tbor_TRINITY_DN9133_c0_g1::TRINITY_DN9133_c0_g1_i1::g.14478::m.14478